MKFSLLFVLLVVTLPILSVSAAPFLGGFFDAIPKFFSGAINGFLNLFGMGSKDQGDQNGNPSQGEGPLQGGISLGEGSPPQGGNPVEGGNPSRK